MCIWLLPIPDNDFLYNFNASIYYMQHRPAILERRIWELAQSFFHCFFTLPLNGRSMKTQINPSVLSCNIVLVVQIFLFDILISCYTLRLLTAYLWYLHCHLQYNVYKICFDILLFSFYSLQNIMPTFVYFFRNISIVVRTKNRFTNEKNINVIFKSDIPISICVYSNI